MSMSYKNRTVISKSNTLVNINRGVYSISMNQKPNYYKALQIAAATTPHEEVFTEQEEVELEESLKGLGYI